MPDVVADLKAEDQSFTGEGASVPPAQESAPAKTAGDSPAKVDGVAEKGDGPTSPGEAEAKAPKLVPLDEVVKYRIKARQEREQREALEKKLAEFEAKAKNGQPQNQSQPDPNAELEKARQFVREEANKAHEQRQISEKRDEAIRYALSQKDVQTEKDEAEIVDILKEPFYQQASAVDPMRAMRMAVQEWRDGKKRVEPGLKAQAGPVRGTAGSSGPRRYTQSEVNRLASNADEKGLNEILSAIREGRVDKD